MREILTGSPSQRDAGHKPETPKLLRRSSLRSLLQHPWQSGLSILGIALAVAVVVGIDLANESSRRAFEKSIEATTGRATHEIIGGPNGIDETLYSELRRRGWRGSAPIIDAHITSPDVPRRTFKLLGVDPLAEGLFRSLTEDLGQGQAGGDLGTFLSRPGAAILARDLADQLGLELGDRLHLNGGGNVHEIFVMALVEPRDELAAQAVRDLLIVDLSSAQEILGLVERLSRIDLLLPDDPHRESRLDELRVFLPPGVEVRAKEERSSSLEQMTRAFRLNLTALSLLALLVGMFLIYNAMTFSVVRRRALFGALRAIGVTRRELFRLILLEGVVIGACGTALGVGLGTLLATGLVQLVVQTLNDFYFVLSVSSVELSTASLWKSLALGVGGTLIPTCEPAYEATTAPPRAVLRRSELERRAHRSLPRVSLAGIALAALGAGILAVTEKHLVLSFIGVLGCILGVACLIPAATLGLTRMLQPVMRAFFGILGSMAVRGVAANLSRTGIAMAALVIAVSVTVGVGVMVHSFRQTLIAWLDVTLEADFYLTSTAARSREASSSLDPAMISAIEKLPEVAFVTTYRAVRVGSEHGEARLAAIRTYAEAFTAYRFTAGDSKILWRDFEQGAVMISEPFAYRHDLDRGDSLELLTDRGRHVFKVAGVFYDYSSDQGGVLMHRATYNRFWDDRVVQSLGIFLSPTAPEARRGSFLSAVEELAGGYQPVQVSASGKIRELSLEIFDRTFLITRVLRILALGVAFVAVLSALMALQLERTRELAVLRANGMTPAQVWGLISAQTALMGLISGLLSLPVGIAMAALLVHVINRRSFGWTLQMELPSEVLLQALILALVGAVLAGLYPAWRMSRSSPAAALRTE